MSHNIHCLNCNTPLVDAFCAHCGQKADTHRITFKHFIFHDILHGIWHFEKGIWFTMKQAILRPGNAALDYISGKRIRYYNVFYLTLLIIGLTIYINHLQDQLSHYYFNTRLHPETDSTGKGISDFLDNNSKLLTFCFVPLFAINSFILFRRKKLNFSEHFIISGMMFLGVMIITTVSAILSFTDYLKYVDFLGGVLNVVTPLSILSYLSINYYKTFSENYTRNQTIQRVFSFIFLLIAELIALIILMVGYFSHWTYTLKIVN